MSVGIKVDALLLTYDEIKEIMDAAEALSDAINDEFYDERGDVRDDKTTEEQTIMILYRVEQPIGEFLKVWSKYTGQVYYRDLKAEQEAKQND